jgi:Uma2 family endonuclease
MVTPTTPATPATTPSTPTTTATAATTPATPAQAKRYTLADLEPIAQPWDDTRYEIVDGALFVSTQPTIAHQYASDQACAALNAWSRQTGRGNAFSAPGLRFADDDNAAPDVVWLSHARLRAIAREDGKLHGPPELVVEVLSPGPENERRDRDVKLRLYSRRGVDEYWIVDGQRRRVEIYRRLSEDPAALRLAAVLGPDETLGSPLLPGFGLPVGELFFTQDR